MMKCRCGKVVVQSDLEPGLWVHEDDTTTIKVGVIITSKKNWDHEVDLDVIEATVREPDRTSPAPATPAVPAKSVNPFYA